jgi:hypothetical protein
LEYRVLEDAKASIFAHVYRQDAATSTSQRKLSAKDLMTEAERILSKTGSGLTLYERL